MPSSSHNAMVVPCVHWAIAGRAVSSGLLHRLANIYVVCITVPRLVVDMFLLYMLSLLLCDTSLRCCVRGLFRQDCVGLCHRCMCVMCVGDVCIVHGVCLLVLGCRGCGPASVQHGIV